MLRTSLVISIFLLLVAPRVDALMLGFDPAVAVVAPGGTIDLQLVASDLGVDVIGDFDLDVSFDPSVLSFSGFVLSDALGDLALGDAFDFSLGEIATDVVNLAVVSTLDRTSLDALQDDPISLATLQFSIVGVPAGGASQVSLAVNALGDELGVALAVDSIADAQLSVIPEPGSALLIGLGLGVLARTRPERPPRALPPP